MSVSLPLPPDVEKRLEAKILEHFETRFLRGVMRWLWGIAGGVVIGIVGIVGTWYSTKMEIAEQLSGLGSRVTAMETWKHEREKAIEEYETFRRNLAADMATLKAYHVRAEKQLDELLRRNR